ncbi:2,3-bisphosphoglycerate-independent phosphoglycerate mutase [Microgenomates group bacterium]|nr:2,3-bisphosphoglycerate-independent phosphoglycerate mutase [Microgenomates group bacterium]
MSLQPHSLTVNLSQQEFTDQHPRQPYQGMKPIVLLVLDGWGMGPNYDGNAILLANTPNIDMFWASFPHTQLAASGEAVGLPAGEDGNSETGHVNIGAGNVVYQELPRLNHAIEDGSFYRNEAFLDAIAHCQKNNSSLHLMGLVGTGGVHAKLEHLLALLDMAATANLTKVYIHVFTDGRDSAPDAAISCIEKIEAHCKKTNTGTIASLMGRFYAMDRDLRWDRIEKAYNCLTLGEGRVAQSATAAIQEQYAQNITDEFIEPVCIVNSDILAPITINDSDSVIFFNFRIDRPRELTKAFVVDDFDLGVAAPEFNPLMEKYEKTVLKQQSASSTFKRKKKVKDLFFVTATRYEDHLPVSGVAFPPAPVKESLCSVFAKHGLKQLRCSETEKEKFVTYYMNGQKEEIFPGEYRCILPSKGEKSYDAIPEMSAYEIAYEVTQRIANDDFDTMIINIANGDMVGHTGNLPAGIRACEIVDEVVGHIVKAVYNKGGIALITADHGNVEEMINAQTRMVDTEHSIYPVPLIIVGKKFINQPHVLPPGVLADIAPTILSLMGLPQPKSMTGRNLLDGYNHT